MILNHKNKISIVLGGRKPLPFFFFLNPPPDQPSGHLGHLGGGVPPCPAACSLATSSWRRAVWSAGGAGGGRRPGGECHGGAQPARPPSPPPWPPRRASGRARGCPLCSSPSSGSHSTCAKLRSQPEVGLCRSMLGVARASRRAWLRRAAARANSAEPSDHCKIVGIWILPSMKYP